MKKVLLFSLLFFIGINHTNASTTTAYSYVLMDQTTGRILVSKNANSPRLIASITKIMTCLLAIESNKLDEVIIIDETIKKAYGSGIYIEVGEQMTLRDMLYGLMLRSGNDAAIMIATYLAGSEEKFAILMNNKAKEIGMKNTLFTNSSGLDNDTTGNYSTAYDMALLTRYAMQYDEYQKIVGTKKHTVKTNYKTYLWNNKNKLLKYNFITGGKTGYTEKAKRTLVSTATINNMNLIVVTIKDNDDWNTHLDLYKYAKHNYSSYKVLNKKKFNIIGDTFYIGEFYIKNDLYLPLKKEETGTLISKIKLEKLSNYNSGDKVGYIEISLNNNILYKEDIFIEKKLNNNTSFLKRIWRKIFK